MQLEHRRWVGRLIKAGLVVAAVMVVLAWIQRKSPVRGDLRVQTEPPAVEQLGDGDLRIYNRDSSVNLILQGPNVLAGLSPKTIERVRAEMQESMADDTAGLGGSIAQLVKKTVSGAIGTHAVYPVRDMREIEYTSGRIVVTRRDGTTDEIFSSVKRNEQKVSETFVPEDAQRFVEAVRARMRELR
ncbi:MAG TPA: hypothetical protein VEB19_11440 [Gemmatimonadaceae bacterium]|nr:hypothetical protein [Gemmatimonadaceae bacterium]